MNLTRDRLHSIGWVTILLICAVLTLILTFRVNAVKSEVRLTERKIAALSQEKLFLETEFESRANQEQLKLLNDVEFGYQAPSAGQYVEGERQLASLGMPRGPNAPSPITVANAEREDGQSALLRMVSPLTGKAMAAEPPRDAGSGVAGAGIPGDRVKGTTAATLKDRLSQVASNQDRQP